MTTPGFSVDPGGLAGVAPQYTDLADQLTATLDTLKGTLDGLGEYWGHDEPGQQYAANYTAARDAALQYHADLVQAYSGIGQTVSDWSDSYANAEDTVYGSM